MDWQGKLISLCLFICNEYKNHLWSYDDPKDITHSKLVYYYSLAER